MSTPVPQTTAQEVSNQLWELALKAGTQAEIRAASSRLLKACGDLQKHDVVAASVYKSNLYALLGDAAQSKYWLENAESNGGKQMASAYRATNQLLLGRISEAYECFDDSYRNGSGGVANWLHKTLASGWFRKAAVVIANSKPTEVPADLRRLTEQGVEMLGALGVEEPAVCRVMDIAHQFMTREKLIWLGSLPDIRFLAPARGGPAIMMTYHLAIAPEHAAALCGELATVLAEQGLDGLGLLVGYQGMKLNDEIQRTRVAALQ